MIQSQSEEEKRPKKERHENVPKGRSVKRSPVRIEFQSILIPKVVSILQTLSKLSEYIYIFLARIGDEYKLHFYNTDDQKYRGIFTLNLNALEKQGLVEIQNKSAFTILINCVDLLDNSQLFVELTKQLHFELNWEQRILFSEIPNYIHYNVSFRNNTSDPFKTLSNPQDSWVLRMSSNTYKTLWGLSTYDKKSKVANILFNKNSIKYYCGLSKEDEGKEGYLKLQEKHKSIQIHSENFTSLLKRLLRVESDRILDKPPEEYLIHFSIDKIFFNFFGNNPTGDKQSKKKKETPAHLMNSHVEDDDVYFCFLEDAHKKVSVNEGNHTDPSLSKVYVFITSKIGGVVCEEFYYMHECRLSYSDNLDLLKDSEPVNISHINNVSSFVNANNKNRNKNDISSFYQLYTSQNSSFVPLDKYKNVINLDNSNLDERRISRISVKSEEDNQSMQLNMDPNMLLNVQSSSISEQEFEINNISNLLGNNKANNYYSNNASSRGRCNNFHSNNLISNKSNTNNNLGGGLDNANNNTESNFIFEESVQVRKNNVNQDDSKHCYLPTSHSAIAPKSGGFSSSAKNNIHSMLNNMPTVQPFKSNNNINSNILNPFKNDVKEEKNEKKKENLNSKEASTKPSKPIVNPFGESGKNTTVMKNTDELLKLIKKE